jgi:hypothetical protein
MIRKPNRAITGWRMTHKIRVLWEEIVRPSIVAPLRRQKIDEGANSVEETLGDGRRKSSRAELISHSLLRKQELE